MIVLKKRESTILIVFLLIFINASFMVEASISGLLTDSNFLELEDKKIKLRIFYPVSNTSNEHIRSKINKHILNFINSHEFKHLSELKKNTCEVSYDITSANSGNYFTIKWLFNCNKITTRIYSINFYLHDHDIELIQDYEVFNPLAKNFINEIVKISENNLIPGINWKQLLLYIKRKDIQFYVLGEKWHIIFNSKVKNFRKKNAKIIDHELPAYLLKSKYNKGVK